MGKKGSKSAAGQAETDWGELKSANLRLTLTPTGKTLLESLCEQLDVSRAEIVERLARRIPIPYPMPCKSLEQLIIRNWDQLVEYDRITVKRLAELRDGAEPTKLEIAQIAVACGTSETEIEQVIRRGKDGCESETRRLSS